MKRFTTFILAGLAFLSILLVPFVGDAIAVPTPFDTIAGKCSGYIRADAIDFYEPIGEEFLADKEPFNPTFSYGNV